MRLFFVIFKHCVKVWDVDNLLEYVHPVDQMDMRIDKLLMCEELKSIIALTRGGLGFWNLETGSLDFQISDNAGGNFLKLAMDTFNLINYSNFFLETFFAPEKKLQDFGFTLFKKSNFCPKITS